jgi:hypothetical protein
MLLPRVRNLLTSMRSQVEGEPLTAGTGDADQHCAGRALGAAEQFIAMVRFAGKYRGAACAAYTLLTSGRDRGGDVADGLQDGAVGGHVDDAPAAAQLHVKRGAAHCGGPGEGLAVQA